MPNRPLPESLLALFAGRDRAAAIYGDLVELAVTRGRIWFWWQYCGTLLGALASVRVWANGISAFICAYLLTQSGWLNRLLDSPQQWLNPLAHLHPMPRAWQFIPLSHFWFLLMVASSLFATFLLPFVLVRYGFRERLSRMVGVTFLLIPLFHLEGGWSAIPTLAAVVIFAAALCARQWRRPAIVLMLTLAVGIPVLRLQYHFIPRRLLFSWGGRVPFGTAYIVMATVCLCLHYLLIDRKPIFTLPRREKQACIS